jgi:hypothetical protein
MSLVIADPITCPASVDYMEVYDNILYVLGTNGTMYTYNTTNNTLIDSWTFWGSMFIICDGYIFGVDGNYIWRYELDGTYLDENRLWAYYDGDRVVSSGYTSVPGENYTFTFLNISRAGTDLVGWNNSALLIFNYTTGVKVSSWYSSSSPPARNQRTIQFGATDSDFLFHNFDGANFDNITALPSELEFTVPAWSNEYIAASGDKIYHVDDTKVLIRSLSGTLLETINTAYTLKFLGVTSDNSSLFAVDSDNQDTILSFQNIEPPSNPTGLTATCTKESVPQIPGFTITFG